MTITVTRALAQVKSLNDRIARGTNTAFVSILTGGKHESGKQEEEVSTVLKSNLQSVKELIARRAELKGAIVRSNAVTEVEIAGKKMTVAEAIERKASIVLDKQLLQQLQSQLVANQSKAERVNVQMQTRLDTLIQTAVGKDRKVDEAELKAITGPFEKQNRAELLDPSNLSKEIETLKKEIESFDEEVDYALSEVNAVTKLTV